MNGAHTLIALDAGPCELRATPDEHELRWQALDDKRPRGEEQARRVELAPARRTRQ
ncbi:MAG TPA: hypothetical protein VMS76_10435 [Planctomycetota bacterium]|nr:hypothetical protein [Planctomycetota bacterium]